MLDRAVHGGSSEASGVPRPHHSTGANHGLSGCVAGVWPQYTAGAFAQVGKSHQHFLRNDQGPPLSVPNETSPLEQLRHFQVEMDEPSHAPGAGGPETARCSMAGFRQDPLVSVPRHWVARRRASKAVAQICRSGQALLPVLETCCAMH